MNENTPKKYDFCIIGTDPSGLSLAQAYSLLGMSVCLVTQNQQSVFEQGLHHSTFYSAIRAGKPLKDAQNLVKFIQKEDRFARSLSALTATGVDVYEQSGAFEDKQLFALSKRDISIHAKKFILALGLTPLLPTLPGIEKVKPLRFEDLLDFKPTESTHVTVCGSQFDCVETAQMLRFLGCGVTIITSKRLLPQEDTETYRFYLSRCLEQGIKVYEHTFVHSINDAPNGQGTELALDIKKENDGPHLKTVPLDKIAFTSNYTVNDADMTLSKAGVAHSSQRIHTNNSLQTSNHAIYAVGSCVTGTPFVRTGDIHTGFFIKKSLFKVPFLKKPEPQSYSYLTYPDVFKFGLSEHDASLSNKDKIHVYRLPYSDGIVPVLEGREKGFIKIVTNSRDIVLGGVIAGENASYIAQTWLLACKKGLKLQDVASLAQNGFSYTDLNKKLAASSLLPKLLNDNTKKVVRFLDRFS